MRSSSLPVKATAFAMLSVLSWQMFLSPIAAWAASVTVPVGTIVEVAFSDPVDPATVSPGQSVRLSVTNAVKVGDVVVIDAGAAALGEVTVAEKNGAIGKPAKIGVTLRHVTAVDGTNIPITGMKQSEGASEQTTALVVTILCCVLGLLMKGGKTTIPQGATVQATTMSQATVTTP